MTEFAGLSTTRLSYFKPLKKVVKSLDEFSLKIVNTHLTFSRAIDAVSPEVSIATTSGSGLSTGRMCFAGT